MARDPIYGHDETNGLRPGTGANYHEQWANARTVAWTEPGLRVVRFRLLSDYDFPAWDVSYCHGMIGQEFVEVDLPFSQLPKRGWKRAIVEYAKRDGVFAAGLGIFENVSTLQ